LNGHHSHTPETMGSISIYTPDSLGEVYCGFYSVPASKRSDSIVTYIMNSSSFPFLNNPDIQYYTTCAVTECFSYTVPRKKIKIWASMWMYEYRALIWAL